MPSDADLLTLCVWTEAQGEPADGMAAVVRVILNRERLHYQSDGTLQGTILHPSAFSAFGFDWTNGAYHHAPDAYTPARVAGMLARARPTPAWAKCAGIAHGVQAGIYVGSEGYGQLTADTVLYVNPKLSHPAWATPAKFVATIGAQDFYRA